MSNPRPNRRDSHGAFVFILLFAAEGDTMRSAIKNTRGVTERAFKVREDRKRGYSMQIPFPKAVQTLKPSISV